MKRRVLIAAISILAVAVFMQPIYADEVSEFQKSAKELSKKLQSLRKEYSSLTQRFNDLRSMLQRMQANDPDYRKIALEHNKVLAARNTKGRALQNLKNELHSKVVNFLSKNTREAVEAVFKTFYRGSSNPDLTVEQAVLEGLRKTTDDSALNFLLTELKTSRRKNARRIICEAIAEKKEDRFTSVLIGILGDRNWEVVVAAARALAKNRAKAAVEPMIAAFERAEDRNEEGAARGLKQALQEMTSEYMLDTARDFRNWWNGKGKESYNENETARPRGLIGKDGPRSTLYGEITSKKVVFVCDVSHSMSARGKVPGEPVDKTGETEKRPETGGDVLGGKKSSAERKKRKLGKQGVKPGYVGMRIEILKIELAHVVTSMLSDDAKFNLVTYSAQVQSWKKSLCKASKTNRKAALDFVKKMQPTGQTNTYGALEAAFQNKSADTIYFLSDGNPTTGKTVDHGEILTAVRRWNQGRNVTIHTIGLLVGKYGNEDQEKLKKFLNDLASQNGGECRVFENK
jgi:HEAT repeat protein